MSILQKPRSRPSAVLFDWHATLVDTHSAMDEVLAQLDALSLAAELMDPADSRTPACCAMCVSTNACTPGSWPPGRTR